MSAAKDLSILIPARNEQFLSKTIDDILQNIEADTEVIAVLDGDWAEPSIPQHERINVIKLSESIGQRATANLACKLSQAKYVMKVDAHCSFDKGFDRKMLEAFKISGDDVTMVPVMRNLWAFDWKCYHCGWKRYQGPRPEKCEQCGKSDKVRMKMVWVGKHNPQSTSYCFDATPHFQYFEDYKHREVYKKDKEEKGLTESMSLQGSCFMLTRDKYWELDICEEEFGYWGSQGIEVACKTWLSGGRVLVNHNTWYAHMFRTQGKGFSFPYPMSGSQQKKAQAYARKLFFNDKWKKQVRPLSWLVEKFWPVPGWSEDDLKKLKANTFSFKMTDVDKAKDASEASPAKSIEDKGSVITKEDIILGGTIMLNTNTTTNIKHRKKKLRKTIYTMNFDNYSPQITKLTYPLIKDYAKKIDAQFVIIEKRRYPDFPMMYEKLQIYELGRENDWNIYIDSDCLVHPDLFDITEVLPRDTVMTYNVDYANSRFKYDNYFRRDGRNIGVGNFLTVASNLCIDIWEPLTDLTLEEAIGNISMTHRELALNHKPGYGIDDYVVSRNVAKYGLKFKTFLALLVDINRPNDEFFFHNHLVPEKEKLILMKQTLKSWRF